MKSHIFIKAVVLAMKSSRLTPELIIVLALWPACSLAGLAALLRSGVEPTKRQIISAMLNSGLFGLICGLWLVSDMGVESWPKIAAISIAAGLGGNSLLVYCIEEIKHRLGTRHEERE